MGPASSWLSWMNATFSRLLPVDKRGCCLIAELIDTGEEGSKRREIERIGTKAAAVPAAMTSENWGSSVYLICYMSVSRRAGGSSPGNSPISAPPSSRSFLQLR